MRAYLHRSRRSHLAYGRRYLGWGVFVLRGDSGQRVPVQPAEHDRSRSGAA
jgi:hypothetical protein